METDLVVCYLESGSTGSCSYEVQQWTFGNYTLLNDTVKTSEGLDLMLCFNCEDWDLKFGGYTEYIVKGEDEEVGS